MRYFGDSENLMRPPPFVRAPIRIEPGLSGQGGQTRHGQIVQSRGLGLDGQQAFCREEPDDFALATLHSAKSYGARSTNPQLTAFCRVTTLHYFRSERLPP